MQLDDIMHKCQKLYLFIGRIIWTNFYPSYKVSPRFMPNSDKALASLLGVV